MPFNFAAGDRWDLNAFTKAFTVAGDNIFAAYFLSNTTPDRQPFNTIKVFKRSDGSYVGDIYPDPSRGEATSTQDLAYGVKALRRSNGQYVILVQDCAFSKIQLYLWCPEGDCPEQAIVANQPHYGKGGKIPQEFIPAAKGKGLRITFDAQGAHALEILSMNGSLAVKASAL
jgi:hypothetical protein